MQHETIWTDRAALTRFRGFLSGDEFLRMAFEITSDPRFDAMEFFVADFTEVGMHDIDHDGVREDLAAQALGGRATNTRYRIVVITRDPAIEQFTRKMRAYYDAPDGPEIIEFGSRELAEQWMALEPARLDHRQRRS